MTAPHGQPPTPRIVTPADEDIPWLIDTMLSGFVNDPLYVWLYPDLDQRRASMRATFDLMLLRGLEHGVVCCTEDRQAVAIWTPPATDLLTEGDLQHWLQRLGEEAPQRVANAAEAMGSSAAHAPPVPHWVLHSVVVHADRQGHGLGSALLRSTLGDLDASEIPAYLESSNIRNVSAYEHLGFRVIGEVAVPDGPTMRPMLRAPRASEG